METLLTKKDEYRYLTNELTREMDTFLRFKSKRGRTYIYDSISPNGGSIGIRYPGATRGGIYFDENMVITKIELYKDPISTISIYKEEVEKCFTKYIGMQLVIEG